MKNQRPYLLRALYEWISDSDSTPYLLVNVESDAVQVPAEFVNNGQIILNISNNAVRDLFIGDDVLSFDGRFSGQAFPVSVPLDAIAAIYAKENGQGMMFEAASESGAEQATLTEADHDAVTETSGESTSAVPAGNNSSAKGSHLKVVK